MIMFMSCYLHIMIRITDLEKNRAFYKALNMKYHHDMDIIQNNKHEATNYFFNYPGQEEELELTFNHNGRTYKLGTGYGHITIGINDLDTTLTALKEQSIEPK